MARMSSDGLTPRQREVWRLVARGHTNGEIAQILGISLDGAKWHVGELLTRLGADNRDELIDLWDARHSPASRLSDAFRALAGFGWARVLGAAAAVGGVAAGTALFANLRSEDAQRTPDVQAAEASTLSEDEARRRAEAVANQLIAAHLAEYVTPGIDVSGLQPVESHLLQPGTPAALTHDPRYTWTPPPGAPAAWAFSWLGEDMAAVPGPLGGTADILITVLLKDHASADVLAEEARVRVTNAGVWHYGHISGFEPTPDNHDSMAPAGEVFELTPPGGGPSGERLLIYRSRSGGYCTRLVHTDGSASGSCGTFGGRDQDDPISILSAGGSGLREGRPPAWFHTIVMRTSPEAPWIAVQSADGSEDRFPTMEIPSELRLPYRVALISTPRLDHEHSFVLYDGDGFELFRKGPWVPDNAVPPYSNGP